MNLGHEGKRFNLIMICYSSFILVVTVLVRVGLFVKIKRNIFVI